MFFFFFCFFNKTSLKFPLPWVWIMFPKYWKNSCREIYIIFAVRNNKQIKCEMMPSQAGALRNRAEIYYKQDQLEKALEDGKHVLKIVKNLYVPPHIEISLALERMAHYHFKLGKKKQKDLDGKFKQFILYYNNN